MYFRRIIIVILLFGFGLSSCEKAKPYARKMRKALERDSEPKQVVGLPTDEQLSEEPPPPPEPVKMEPVINKKARVAVLGYHDFTESRRPTQMIIDIDDFRSQMQAIKDAEIPVISMRQFLDWKQGKADIPAESILITIDDGWKDTHTLAMPVLREFGFPFTAYLYQKYVGVGGRSMTYTEVNELIESGGTICSHSIAHKNMAKPPGRTSDEKIQWLKAELEDSHHFLTEHFSHGVIKTFAFPFGIYNDQVLELAEEFGYEACFTVSPGKTTWDTENMTINRYIVHGNSASTFDAALRFGSAGGSTASGRKLLSEQRDKKTGEIKGPLVEVYPPNNSTVKNRLPRIEVNFSSLERVQPESIVMRIDGLGKIPHVYNSTTKLVSYQIPQRIRLENCGVQISFRHSGNKKQELIGWNFAIDKRSEYLDSKVTFIRPASEPVDPSTDLIIPEPKEKIETEESASEDLPNATASSN